MFAVLLCCSALAMPPEYTPKTATGVVVDASGKPVVEAKLAAYWMTSDGGPVRETQTDAEGRFSFRYPDPQIPGINVWARGPQGEIGWSSVRRGDQDAPHPLVEITLKPPRNLTLRVIDQQDRPVEGASVQVISLYPFMESPGRTGANGETPLPLSQGLPTPVVVVKENVGIGLLLVGYPEGVGQSVADDIEGTVIVKLEPTKSVEVRVTDHRGEPVPDAEVHLDTIRLSTGGNLSLDSPGFGPEWFHRTDENGRATVDHVSTTYFRGIQHLHVSKTGYVSKGATSFEPAKVDVVEVTLLPTVTLSGKVTLPDGSSAAGVPIIVQADPVQAPTFSENIISGEDGRFSVDVPPDSYCLLVARSDQWSSPLEARVARMGKAVDNVDLRLQPSTRIAGRVLAYADNKPIAHAPVILVQKESRDGQTPGSLPGAERMRAMDPRQVKSISLPTYQHVDTEGRFEFHVGPGHYTLMEFTGGGPYDSDSFFVNGQEEFEFTLRGERVDRGR